MAVPVAPRSRAGRTDAYALKRRISRDHQRLQAFYESISTEIDRSTKDDAAKAQARESPPSSALLPARI